MGLKGISWVGDVYKRFEDMCIEVDGTMCEDTLKYVETQMQTVGETVKKFYSDVIQDLAPPSPLDPVAEVPLVTVAHHGDVANCEKPKVDNENESANATSKQMVKDSGDAAAIDNSVNDGSCCVIEPCEPAINDSASGKEQHTDEHFQNHCAEIVLSNRTASMEKDLCSSQASEPKLLSDMSSLNPSVIKDSGKEFTCTEPHHENDEPICEFRDVSSEKSSVLEVSHNKEDGVGISRKMVECYGSGGVVTESKTGIPSSGYMSSKLDETSNPFLVCEIKSEDAADHEIQVSEQLNKVKLEGPCVLVEKSNDSSQLALEVMQRSYKKTIRDVFSRRRWSKSKRDKKQLAVWYEEQSGNHSTSVSVMHAEVQNSQTSESSDSEWEFL